MAGPYATIDRVKKIGGLNEDSDYLMYRFASPDELDAEVTEAITMASATIRDDATAIYDAPTALQLIKITRGECYYALYWLYPALKARKVTGTHWPLDQEGSDRFQELIDVEWKSLAQEALTGIVTITPEGQNFARPVFLVSRATDPLTDVSIDSEAVQIENIARRARSLECVP